MIYLKKLDWNDKWENYIEYGHRRPVFDGRSMFTCRSVIAMPCVYTIISVMHQLEGKMTVYEAFLKGLELCYSSESYGWKSFYRSYRRIQNKLYRNMKKRRYRSFPCGRSFGNDECSRQMVFKKPKVLKNRRKKHGFRIT